MYKLRLKKLCKLHDKLFPNNYNATGLLPLYEQFSQLIFTKFKNKVVFLQSYILIAFLKVQKRFIVEIYGQMW